MGQDFLEGAGLCECVKQPQSGRVARQDPSASARAYLGAPSRDRLADMFREFRQEVASYAVRLGVSGSDLEDVVADVFFVASRRIDDIPDPPNDRVWMLVTTRNVARKVRYRRFRVFSLLNRMQINASEAPGIAPDDAMAVRNAVANLPMKLRDVVILICWHGLTHEESSAVLGCSAEASRVRFHRAKALLRASLDPPNLETKVE